MITLARKLLLIVAFISSLLFALFQGGFVSWFLFAFVGPVLLYSIGFAFFVNVKRITIQREILTTKRIANNPLEIKITLTNDNWYPLFFLYLEEEISDSLLQSFVYHQPRTHLFFVRRKKVEWIYRIEKVSRGKHQFFGTRLRLGDLFSFAVIRKENELKEEILVYPEIVPLKVERGTFQLEDGAIFSNNSVNIHHTLPISVREYQSGDRLSWINWKATAKRQQLMTKEFENRKSVDMTIILDTYQSGPLEAAISFTASLVNTFITGQSSVTIQYLQRSNNRLITNGDVQQFDKMMYDLAILKGQSTTDFNKFKGIVNDVRKNQVIYLILPHLTDKWITLINEYTTKAIIFVFIVKQDYQVIVRRDNEQLTKFTLQNQVHFIKEGHFQYSLDQAFRKR